MRPRWTLELLRLALLLVVLHPIDSLQAAGHVRAPAARRAQQPTMQPATHALQRSTSGVAKRLSPHARPARSSAPALLAKAPMVDRYAFCCYGCGAELQARSAFTCIHYALSTLHLRLTLRPVHFALMTYVHSALTS
eukprot:6203235-Pleurochrysis_carterae.AAC.1